MSDAKTAMSPDLLTAFEAFLVERATPLQRDVIRRFHDQMVHVAPEANLRMRGGTEKYHSVPVYRIVRDIVAVSPNKAGVAFSFTRGADLEDPSGALDGQGKRSRAFRVAQDAAYPEAEIAQFIRQAVALDKPDTGETNVRR
ncbi:MAG: DUF1801 domain-containing protein [Jannaschia sp.]